MKLYSQKTVLIIVLLISIIKLGVSSAIFSRVKTVMEEPDDEKKLQDLQLYFSGTPLTLTNTVLGAFLVTILIMDIIWKFSLL